MPTLLGLLLASTLLPFGAFVLLAFAGKRIGNPVSGWFGAAAISGSFLCTMLAMVSWFMGGRTPGGTAWGKDKGAIDLAIRWIPIGTAHQPTAGLTHPGWLDVGVYIDSLTIAMFAMITLVAMMVHLFSIGYMRRDKRYPRFFAYLGLFCFSMMGLVLGGTLLQLFIFWELVGLCSYFLIGFWYEKKSASNAAIKAFVANRIGDFGFLIGFAILIYQVGNVSLPYLWATLGDGARGLAVSSPDGGVFSTTLLTLTGICLFCGAIGKSAQFPLHVWLPDAMEGPTPASALIHAATMVAAGVYLVGRIFPILTPDARLFIAIIGCITLTMAALIAIAQSDIKRLLAFSTISQLGYMMLAMGVGSWVGGLFHLITHAFFKSLLFLGAGSIIAAARHEQELPEFGGLIRKIPVTGVTFFVAVLAMAGAPFFSGSYSKDLILAHAGAFATLAHGQGRSEWYRLLFVLPTATAYVTAFYMMRCWMLTFWGQPRNQRLHDRARESPVMYGPLIVLAGVSVISGSWLNVRELLESSVRESNISVSQITGRPITNVFASAWPGRTLDEVQTRQDASGVMTATDADLVSPAAIADRHGWDLTHRFALPAFLVGIVAAVFIYWRGYGLARRLVRIRPLGQIHAWLYHRMYFDELYFSIFVAITVALSRFIAWFDRVVVDGIVNLGAWSVKQLAFGIGANDRIVVDGAVTAVTRFTHGIGSAVRKAQTGRIRAYVMALVLMIAVGLVAAIVAVISK